MVYVAIFSRPLPFHLATPGYLVKSYHVRYVGFTGPEILSKVPELRLMPKVNCGLGARLASFDLVFQYWMRVILGEVACLNQKFCSIFVAFLVVLQ